MKKYRVTLAAERGQLRGLPARGRADVRKLKHARLLLKADETADGPGCGVEAETPRALRSRPKWLKEVPEIQKNAPPEPSASDQSHSSLLPAEGRPCPIAAIADSPALQGRMMGDR